MTIQRKKTVPTTHFFLFGPRGTGKTTWLRTSFPDALYLDLNEPGNYREFLATPESLESLAESAVDRRIILDEIQRVPGLLPVVHRCIDRNFGKQFILTGSSARKLRRSGSDLLGGRAFPEQMHPFMASELGDAFDFDRALRYGMLPLIHCADDPQNVLRGYSGIYLDQEVKAEASVRNPESFARFLRSLSFSQASVLNLSSVARDCQVKRSTVASFLEITQDLLIACMLPVFTRRAKRTAIVHPKFFYFDCGVYRSLRPTGPLDNPGEIDGVALETLVFQHLRGWIGNGAKDHELFYWRTSAGNEVDFVVYGEETFAAIEVKNSGRVRPEDLRGLKAFFSDYPECKPVLLYRGTERMTIDGISCIPVDAFLRELRGGDGLYGCHHPSDKLLITNHPTA